MADLSVELAPKHPSGLRLRNPVMTASGTFGYAREMQAIVDRIDTLAGEVGALSDAELAQRTVDFRARHAGRPQHRDVAGHDHVGHA